MSTPILSRSGGFWLDQQNHSRSILSPLVAVRQTQTPVAVDTSACSTPLHSPIMQRTPSNACGRIVNAKSYASPLKQHQAKKQQLKQHPLVADDSPVFELATVGRKLSFSTLSLQQLQESTPAQPSLIAKNKKKLVGCKRSSLASSVSSSACQSPIIHNRSSISSNRTPLSSVSCNTPLSSSRRSAVAVGSNIVDMDDVSVMLKQLDLLDTPVVKHKINSPRTSPAHHFYQTPSKSHLKRAGQLHSKRTGLLNTPTQWQKKKTCYDRFIPNRAEMDLTSTFANLTMKSNNNDNTTHSMPTMSFSAKDLANNDSTSASRLDTDCTFKYQNEIAKACGLNLDNRILPFNSNHAMKSSIANSHLSRPLRPKTTAAKRKIPTAPERVLDAPGIADDFYLNLLDWSCANIMAVGLGNSVYLWNATMGTVSELCSLDDEEGVASVSWSQDGSYVAIGDFHGKTHIWDVETESRIRSLHNPDTRIGVLSWNREILSCGTQMGTINNHDVRIPQSLLGTSQGHEGDITGLKWSHDGSQLASGGNDNLVNIWDARSNQPKFTKREHMAAVKAVGWCPWQSNLLATGGGSDDQKIHFWNTATGAKNATIDTGSQVTGIIWSKTYRELVSTHGYSENQLMIWKYPTLKKVMELPNAHQSRILHSSISPDGQVVCTGAADETLKFWKLFGLDSKILKTKTSGAMKGGNEEKKNISPDLGFMNIR